MNYLACAHCNSVNILSDVSHRWLAVLTNDYATLTISADKRTIATVQQKPSRSIYLLPAGGFSGDPPAPVVLPEKDFAGFSWAGNQNLLLDEPNRLVRISIDGGTRATPASDPKAFLSSASDCAHQPTGATPEPETPRLAVFAWAGHDPSNSNQTIWRVNLDGSNLKELSHGKSDQAPRCSPDGKWVYFVNRNPDHMLRVPLDGGTAEEVPGTKIPDTIYGTQAISISPDGKLLAFVLTEASTAMQNSSEEKIALVSLDPAAEGARRLISPNPQISGPVEFTPDGKALAYAVRERGTDNLWLQPLNGSTPRRITNFTAERSRGFGWSPDGKTLAIDRFHNESDVVLLHDTGSGPK